MQIKPINILIICLGCFVGGFVVGKWLSKPKTETITVKEIKVVKDTTEARMFADQTAALQKRIDEYEKMKPVTTIKYVEIYKDLPTLTVPEVDSNYERAVRFDNN